MTPHGVAYFTRAGEIAGWVNGLQQGLSRQAVVVAFLGSVEHDADQVNQIYQQYLHRSPDAGGLAAWEAAIDDYELSLRFMNDLATYRIDVSWLWSLLHHRAAITKDGYLKRPALTEDGVVPAVNASEIKAGTRFTKELFEKLWDYHNEWTSEFFAELDRHGDPGRFDRAKAPIIMEILKRQLLSGHYIQHSARVLFVVGQANKQERGQILEAIFDLSREEIIKRVQAGTLNKIALAAHDYVYDIFPGMEAEQRPKARSR